MFITKSDVPAFYAYDNAGGTQIIGITDVPLDTEVIKEYPYAHSNVTNNPEVTIAEQGDYLIYYFINCNNNNLPSVDKCVSGQLAIDTGGGFATVAGSFSYGFQHNSASNPLVSFHRGIIMSFNDGDKIKMQAVIASGSPTPRSVISSFWSKSSISIIKLT